MENVTRAKVYQKMFSARRLQRFRDEIACPQCDKVCQEMVMLWASGPLLAARQDMDEVADAILKVYENRDKLRAV